MIGAGGIVSHIIYHQVLVDRLCMVGDNFLPQQGGGGGGKVNTQVFMRRLCREFQTLALSFVIFHRKS